MKAFEEYHIKQITSAAVQEILPDGVKYKNAADSSDQTIYEARGFDTVVLSMGFVSRYTHREGRKLFTISQTNCVRSFPKYTLSAML